MKAGWDIKPLGKLCEFQRGLTYSKTDEVADSENIVLRANNVDLETNTLDLSDLRCITDNVHVPEGKKIRQGSLLICTASGSKSHLGKVAFVDDNYGYAFGGFMGQITPNADVDGRFLFHVMTSAAYKDFIAQLSDGANINNLKFNDLQNFQVAVPSIEEQHRIVILLEEAFADIATAKANAEKNLQNARELFESHLDTSFGQRNESWTEKALQDIGSTQTGSTPKTSDQANYGNVLPFIKPGDFAPDGTLNYKNDGLSAQGAASARKVSANSVLMVCIGATIGKCGYSDREIATNQQINAFTPEAGIDKKFIYYQMLTKRFQDRVIHGSGQATLPIINKSKWSALTVFLPATLEEQEAIAKKLDAIREETQRLEVIYRQKLTTLDDLKKSLLHQAFSGQL